MTKERNLNDLQELVSLSKRRGFAFQSSEIYGGINACWDFGPLGVELKNSIKRRWWEAMTRREDVVGIDASILMHPMVWEASGHLDGFTDPLVDCKECKSRFRADQLDEENIKAKKCPSCSGELTEPRAFNLMFKTFMGPVEDSASTVFLRPETAQGIFVNFENVQRTSRKKIPFGIAQIGKSFRNEITPGNFIFRTREFEQMEMQFFVKPGEDDEWFEKWKATRLQWHLDLGLREEKLRFSEHGPGELAHYAKAAFDIEYELPIGWQELEGIHNRTDFDLKQHQQFSKKNLQYVDQENNEKYIPYVVETAVGCDRTFLAVMADAYRVELDDEGKESRTVLKLNPSLAPIKAAFLPLSKKAELIEISRKCFDSVSQRFSAEYDESGSIGKRYRRHDEIGTPWCVTVDFDTLEDNAVTLRERDEMKQERVSLDKLDSFLSENL